MGEGDGFGRLPAFLKGREDIQGPPSHFSLTHQLVVMMAFLGRENVRMTHALRSREGPDGCQENGAPCSVQRRGMGSTGQGRDVTLKGKEGPPRPQLTRSRHGFGAVERTCWKGDPQWAVTLTWEKEQRGPRIKGQEQGPWRRSKESLGWGGRGGERPTGDLE